MWCSGKRLGFSKRYPSSIPTVTTLEGANGGNKGRLVATQRNTWGTRYNECYSRRRSSSSREDEEEEDDSGDDYDDDDDVDADHEEDDDNESE
ncbi:hypothetical protein QVD17_20476 [Tagetes erecta]|uniref:Uncharacterized protein n=1 Tax=Tagetes erecta TaxID=13708 RepID=A0AAD8NY72_TARER|nr:hypothetical protein QVD17_20476 [Tagetes erecta]